MSQFVDEGVSQGTGYVTYRKRMVHNLVEMTILDAVFDTMEDASNYALTHPEGKLLVCSLHEYLFIVMQNAYAACDVNMPLWMYISSVSG